MPGHDGGPRRRTDRLSRCGRRLAGRDGLRLQRQYSGDLNYTGSTSPTNSELLTISKGSTSIATTLAGIGTGGLATSTVYDTATITYAPTPPSFPVAGTVTYTFTGTELASLTPPTGWTEPSSGGTTWTDTVNVAANGSVPNSAAVGALPAGTDYVFSADTAAT